LKFIILSVIINKDNNVKRKGIEKMAFDFDKSHVSPGVKKLLCGVLLILLDAMGWKFGNFPELIEDIPDSSLNVRTMNSSSKVKPNCSSIRSFDDSPILRTYS